MTAEKKSKELKKETVKDLDAPAEQAGGVKGGVHTGPPERQPGVASSRPEMGTKRRGLTQKPGGNPGPIH